MTHLTGTPSSIEIVRHLPTQTVTGFPISTLSFLDQVDVIAGWAAEHLSKMVCVSNVHMLMEGHWHPGFAQILTGADMLTPDGMPLVWMTSLMNRQPQERVAGVDLMRALCLRSQAEGISIFFLGSTPEVLDQIRQQLSKEFPNLKVAGMVSPPFRELNEAEDRAIAQCINDSQAGLVFVSLGCPKQERWMHAHREQIRAVMVGLGGAFPVYAGIQQWAPERMRRLGLEWLYRLIQEPKRLWKRYARTIPPFLWLAFKQVLKLRLGMNPELAFRQQWARHS